MIKESGGKSPRQTAILLAFYFSVPFLIYDFIYLRLFKELPLFYLIDYWYLTIFSAPPWMIFPAVTSRIEARKV